MMLKNRLSKVLILAIIFPLLASAPAAGAVGHEIVSSGSNIIADISEEVADSVVLVSTERDVQVARRHPFYDDPIFRFFFPDHFREEEEREEIRRGSGTGFIVSEEGHIVTNQHVIEGSDRIYVTMRNDEENYSASVIWADYSLDLAVLKIEDTPDLQPIKLGDSDQIRQGDWAIAIGNPYGFEHTVTIGVIGALGRPIEVPTERGQIRRYSNLIQTDAAINPGNSGGPLLNIQGEVVGINTAVATRAQGIGFAIPINEVKFALEEIREYGRVSLPWLGIYYQTVTPQMQEYFQLSRSEGIIVMDVVADSPAEAAGLKPYDIILEVNREPVSSTEDFARSIRETEVGERIMLRVLRDGSPRLLFATIDQRPTDY